MDTKFHDGQLLIKNYQNIGVNSSKEKHLKNLQNYFFVPFPGQYPKEKIVLIFSNIALFMITVRLFDSY